MQNLDDFVKAVVPNNMVHLIPVVEKEIIHYEIFDALEKLGLIEQLKFHGGTCLRLCYGAVRRSEDLDFAYDGYLDELDLRGLQQCLERSLGKSFGLEIRVKPPRRTVEFKSASMQRWWLVIDTAPARPDLPSQKLKIEIATVKTLTQEVCKIARNYDFLPQSCGLQLAICETCEEILADKIVSFVNTDYTYLRKRDLWDMLYLAAKDKVDVEKALGMVAFKKDVYGCLLENEQFVLEGKKRVKDVGCSDAFSKEMMRFMPHDDFNAIFGSEIKRKFGIDQICNLYEQLA